MHALNQAQLNILKLFQSVQSEQDIEELRKVLIDFLAKKTVQEADKAFDERGYTTQDLQNWPAEHHRRRGTDLISRV